MSIENLLVRDPFGDVGSGASEAVVHIRLALGAKGEQTLVQGLDIDMDLMKSVSIALCERFGSSAIVTHAEWGMVIQLQGDHRQGVADMLVAEDIWDKQFIRVH